MVVKLFFYTIIRFAIAHIISLSLARSLSKAIVLRRCQLTFHKHQTHTYPNTNTHTHTYIPIHTIFTRQNLLSIHYTMSYVHRYWLFSYFNQPNEKKSHTHKTNPFYTYTISFDLLDNLNKNRKTNCSVFLFCF